MSAAAWLLRRWRRFWYNDVSRMLFVLLPGHFLVTVLPLALLGLRGQALKSWTIFVYIAVFLWALVDNDFTKKYKD
jgi:pilus assembly protein TadC